jgi:hypothetical protein
MREDQMDLEKLISAVSRLFFFGAFLLLVLAVLERITLSLGGSLLGGSFDPGRLLEYAVILLIFVIALLLRQIRESPRKV